MPRPRAFDEDRVLARALDAFWRRGYRATSLDELLGAMSLSKSSFYGAFGSKRAVLLEALRRYAASGMDGLLAPLLRADAGRAAIEETFAGMARWAASAAGRRGCLVNSCLVERTDGEPQVARATRAVVRAREDLLAAAVRRGQEAGDIARDESPRALARYLANALTGINVLARANPGNAALGDVVRLTLRALGPGRRRRIPS